MTLKYFVFETEITKPGAAYDRRTNTSVFLTIAEPMFSFGHFDRESSFIVEVSSFPDEGDEGDDNQMKIYCRGMLSLIEDGNAVLLNLADSTQPEAEQYRSRFFTQAWRYLENCARQFFPDAAEFYVSKKTFEGDHENWAAFQAKLGYRQDSVGEFSRKPAVSARTVQLPKPIVIEKVVEAVW